MEWCGDSRGLLYKELKEDLISFSRNSELGLEEMVVNIKQSQIQDFPKEAAPFV